MTRRVIRRAIIASVAVLSSFAQQPTTPGDGVVSGNISGDDGSAVEGAYVTLHLWHKPSQSVRQRFESQWGLYSGSGGSFRFTGLPSGMYRLCAQAPGTEWLDPCEWGLPIPSVALTNAGRSRILTVVLKKGVEVPIRIDDPRQLLPQHEGRTTGAHLLVGVSTPASTFRPAVLTSREGTGRNLKVVIPYDRPVHVAISSSFFKLADSNGTQFPKPGIAIPVRVPAGERAAPVRVAVTGGN
jgi:hypothetical protein